MADRSCEVRRRPGVTGGTYREQVSRAGPAGSREATWDGWEAPVESSADSVLFNFKLKCKQAPVPGAPAQIKLVL